MKIDRDAVKQMALDAGFKLKEQADGTIDLHQYVYDFAQAVADHAVKAGCTEDER